MIYENNPSNERYLQEQLYSKKEVELPSVERELQIYMAVYNEKTKTLQTSIDSIERQLENANKEKTK